jgi:hypothetical protein
VPGPAPSNAFKETGMTSDQTKPTPPRDPRDLEADARVPLRRLWSDFRPCLADGSPDWWRLMAERRASTVH